MLVKLVAAFAVVVVVVDVVVVFGLAFVLARAERALIVCLLFQLVASFARCRFSFVAVSERTLKHKAATSKGKVKFSGNKMN